MKAILAGAGVSGFLHALAYRAHGVAIAGIYDPDAQRARDLSEVCGGRAVETFEQLTSMDAQLASVCSPPRVHVEQAERLAAGGRTVLIEKPVGVSMRELSRLRALARCVPIVQWRAGRALRAVRRAIHAGELGEAPVVSCDLAWARDDDYLRARGAAWGCGAVLSVGIHALDAVQWAVSRRVLEVSGATSQRAGAWAETGAVALVRFEGGALASMRISLDGGADLTRLVFCGRDVTATIEGGEGDPTAGAVTWHVARGPGAHARLASLEALERETRGSLGSPLVVPYIGDVVAALRDGCAPGESPRIPSIADCFDAHVTALRVTGGAAVRERARPGSGPCFP